MNGKQSSIRQSWRLPLFVIVIVCLIIIYTLLFETGLVEQFSDAITIKQWLQELGMGGPILIVGVMTLAIILSPIPSAPIALAAGAAYGHTQGTIYVLIGAELGAIIAFYIARLSGVDILRRWLGGSLPMRLLGSQHTLMAIVFASRLMPFISFDMVSYAAGLTPLKFWRFAIATIAGIIPASFLLVHFGAEMASADGQQLALILTALGLVTLLPVLVKVYIDERNSGSHNNGSRNNGGRNKSGRKDKNRKN